ncbi:MAG: allophanate hydrolase [Alphaproteobacteria bacterium]|jgi:allophanate hydrolase|nr:allophanate hydrolase [Alphaproteobacteria bacterium]
MSTPIDSLDITSLRALYRSGAATPVDVIRAVRARIAARGDDKVWLHLPDEAEAIARAEALMARGNADDLPLYGIPFAIKDNIDVAGWPTTAACPDFSYVPAVSATVVARLEAAGALAVGKTNLDQFATGLVGVRSPYGAPSCVFDPAYVSGGSSSGSAVAVAAGLVSFSLGTDTAGSGRVPAMLNNLVGIKPTRGLIPTTGVVPACRSLDCVSIFGLATADALAVLDVAKGFDAGDIYARSEEPELALVRPGRFRFGVPAPEALEFYGNADGPALFAAAVARLERIGGTAVPIDFGPFRETALLLYEGPWVAERVAAIEDFFRDHADSLHPVTRAIYDGAAGRSAVEAFKGLYRLEALKRRCAAEMAKVDCLLLPTAPTNYTHADLAAEPIRYNSNLGHYTNFMNLLDMSGIAYPAGFRPNGLPFGVTLAGPALADARIAAIAAAAHADLGGLMGGTSTPLPPVGWAEAEPAGLQIAVVGAHLSGQPLNDQLTSRGATLVASRHTAPTYRLYAMGPRPGLIRVAEGGAPIALEVWSVPAEAVGGFLALVPPPLAIGSVELDDGSWVKGFVCEGIGIVGAEDITAYGGWRAWREKR